MAETTGTMLDLVEETTETSESPSSDAKEEDTGSAPRETFTAIRRRLAKIRWRWVALLLLLLNCATAVAAYLLYRAQHDELVELHQLDADTAAVAQLSKDYVTKSLTYSFANPDAYFAAVQTGVAPTLKDKYVNATEILKTVMLEAKVTSTGDALAADAQRQPDGSYNTVVAATQTTRNVQQPQQRTSIVLLQVTVTRSGDTWQISDIGPKAGTPTMPDSQPEPGPIPQQPAPIGGTSTPAPPGRR